MDLTKEEALKLHREMWGDMQKELGDNPSEPKRFVFKNDWVKKHGYVNVWGVPDILDNCFLCEFALGERYEDNFRKMRCKYCPIDWSSLTNKLRRIDFWHKGYPNTCMFGSPRNDYGEIWQTESITDILNLPEKF